MSRIILTAIAIVIASMTVSRAEDAPASPDWTTVQRACGGEYRAADKASRPTWQEFLNECKVRKGFQPKKAARSTVTLPDVVKKD